MPLTALTLSFECDQTSRESMSVVGSSDAPIIYQANETAIRASLFDGAPSSTTFVTDISNVLSARLVIRKNHTRGIVLLDKEATLDGTTTYSNWSAGTKQHFLFELSEVETNQAVPSDGTLDIYAVIEIVTGSGPIVIGFFNGEIQYDGITGVSDPVPPTLGAETANTVYAGPSSGLANLPDFRALVSADIPALAESKITNLVSDLAARQPLDATLTALAGVTTATDKVIYATGVDTFNTMTVTSYARTVLDDTDAVTMRGTLGLTLGTSGATVPLLSTANVWTLSQTGTFLDVGGQVINIKAAPYSATGNGTTDDTAAFTSALAAGSHILVPPGTYKITSLVTVAPNKTVQISAGATVSMTSATAATAFEIQGDATGHGTIFGAGTITSSRTAWNPSQILTGVLMSGATGVLDIGAITNFDYGVSLIGANQGCAWNSVHVHEIRECMRSVNLDATGAGGYVNQNYIQIDRQWISTSRASTENTAGNYTNSYGIYMDSHSSTSGNWPNANRFSGDITGGYIGMYLTGGWNRIDGLRFELQSAPVAYAAKIQIENATCGGVTDKNWWFGEYGNIVWTTDITGGAKTTSALQGFGVSGVPLYLTSPIVSNATASTWAKYDANKVLGSGITPGTGVETFLTTPSSANLASAITDETGTGALMFNISPRIVTSILDANGATILSLSPATTAVNFFTIGNSATTSGLALTASGTDTNISIAITPKGSGQISLPNSSFINSSGAFSCNTVATMSTAGFQMANNLPFAISSTGLSNGTKDLGLSRVSVGLLGIGNGTAGDFTGSWKAANGTLTGSLTTGSISLTGNQSAAAWTTSGLRIVGVAGTLTDTSSSGTVAAAYTNKLGGNTIAASNATTFTNYISAYFSDPVAGTNVTFTNKYGLGADSLRVGTSNSLTVSPAGVLTTYGAQLYDAAGTPKLAANVNTRQFFDTDGTTVILDIPNKTFGDPAADNISTFDGIVATTNNGFQITGGTPDLTVDGNGNFVGQLQSNGLITAPRIRLTNTTVTYSASMTPDAAAGTRFIITATNGTAFTINAPTNVVVAQTITVTIRNTSGGALGAATWNAVFKMASWTQPANAFSRSISFNYDGTNWVETSRTPADVPN